MSADNHLAQKRFYCIGPKKMSHTKLMKTSQTNFSLMIFPFRNEIANSEESQHNRRISRGTNENMKKHKSLLGHQKREIL